MHSSRFLATAALAALVAGCSVPPKPSTAPDPIPEGWFASADELCDSIRKAAVAKDEPALIAMEIPESLWVVSTWHVSDVRAAAKDSAHERASREFARWLHLSNSRKGRLRLIQALRDAPDSTSGCPPFDGTATTVGPLELHSFPDSGETIRLAGSLARLGKAWRVHSFAEAGAKR